MYRFEKNDESSIKDELNIAIFERSMYKKCIDSIDSANTPCVFE